MCARPAGWRRGPAAAVPTRTSWTATCQRARAAELAKAGYDTHVVYPEQTVGGGPIADTASVAAISSSSARAATDRLQTLPLFAPAPDRSRGHERRTRGGVEQTRRDRAEQQAGNRSVAARADEDEIGGGTLRDLGDDACGTTANSLLDMHLRVAARLGQLGRASLTWWISSSSLACSGRPPARPTSTSRTCTISNRTPSGAPSCRSSGSARSEASEPSSAITIVENITSLPFCASWRATRPFRTDARQAPR